LTRGALEPLPTQGLQTKEFFKKILSPREPFCQFRLGGVSFITGRDENKKLTETARLGPFRVGGSGLLSASSSETGSSGSCSGHVGGVGMGWGGRGSYEVLSWVDTARPFLPLLLLVVFTVIDARVGTLRRERTFFATTDLGIRRRWSALASRPRVAR